MNKLYLGDNIEVIKSIPDNSIDSIVTDPPYGLGKEPKVEDILKGWLETGTHEVKGGGFMNKEWDSFVPSPAIWKECLRVLKPGGHLLSFFGTRTYDYGVMAIRLAGFEIRDQIAWVYGSGFPKGINIGKAIDKIQGNEREKIGEDSNFGITTKEEGKNAYGDYKGTWDITKGDSPYEGWNTNLKPALEPIVLARKPITEKTIAENVLKYGTGGINIDGCRVETKDNLNDATSYATKPLNKEFVQPSGRYPANFIHDGSDEVVQMFPAKVEGKDNFKHSASTIFNNKTNKYNYNGNSKSTYGSASRFFYVAKSSKKERNLGLDNLPKKGIREAEGNSDNWDLSEGKVRERFVTKPQSNFHPTVKPINLMKYLCRLITPKNGTVLDPFMGSGSTGIGATLEGFNFIGIEQEREYYDIAEARINYWENNQENKFEFDE